jgi:exopolysaccharide biosynthesis WecB/TagA/CpsF family protein
MRVSTLSAPSAGMDTVSAASVVRSPVDVFGMAFENVTLSKAARDLVSTARNGRQSRVVFVNAHVINEAARDDAYLATVATAQTRYADGSGMAVAAKLVGRPFIDNVNGTDLFPELCREAMRSGVSIFLLGAKPGVAEEAAANVAKTGHGRAIAGTHHGYFAPGSQDEARVIAEINASGAGIVLVAMGVPVQDQWIERNRSRLTAPVLAGVGGLFDFASGRMSRAPHVFRTVGCEWVWRLAMEPKRMWQRYLIGNAIFIMHAVVAAWREAHDQRRSTKQPTAA